MSPPQKKNPSRLFGSRAGFEVNTEPKIHKTRRHSSSGPELFSYNITPPGKFVIICYNVTKGGLEISCGLIGCVTCQSSPPVTLPDASDAFKYHTGAIKPPSFSRLAVSHASQADKG